MPPNKVAPIVTREWRELFNQVNPAGCFGSISVIKNAHQHTRSVGRQHDDVWRLGVDGPSTEKPLK
ncbi:hypothetical protein OUZ56_015017 [Daphnia magna]|uniref:Uncharacterized protein n=1 Tax=Daphnia magna TaxID=35525 RepID=A0ABR0ALJ8_9CRUS|nr:hypothetical protein OUZ56_015017 [Daphnia magna]